jgi:hypothetical protein
LTPLHLHPHEPLPGRLPRRITTSILRC